MRQAREGFGRPEKALAGQRRLWQENSGTECPKTEKALAGQRRLWQAKEGFGRLKKALVGQRRLW